MHYLLKPQEQSSVFFFFPPYFSMFAFLLLQTTITAHTLVFASNTFGWLKSTFEIPQHTKYIWLCSLMVKWSFSLSVCAGQDRQWKTCFWNSNRRKPRKRFWMQRMRKWFKTSSYSNFISAWVFGRRGVGVACDYIRKREAAALEARVTHRVQGYTLIFTACFRLMLIPLTWTVDTFEAQKESPMHPFTPKTPPFLTIYVFKTPSPSWPAQPGLPRIPEYWWRQFSQGWIVKLAS